MNSLDKMLLLELKNYGFSGKMIPVWFKDSHTFFRSTKDKQLNTLLWEWGNPNEKDSSEIDDVLKRPPGLSMEIDFIYGFECYQRRKTLFYVHQYDEKDQAPVASAKEKNKKGTERQDPLLPDYLVDQMIFPKNTKPRFPEIYYNAERHLAYFAGRTAIIYSQHNNSQRFYQGHTSRITCMDIHPNSKAFCAIVIFQRRLCARVRRARTRACMCGVSPR